MKAMKVLAKAKAIRDDPLNALKDNQDFQKGKALFNKAKAMHDDPMSLVQDNEDFQKGKALFDKGKALHDDPMSLVKDNQDFQKGKALFDKAKALHDDPMSLMQDNEDFQKGKALFDKAKALHDDPMSLVQDNQDFQKGKALFDKAKAVHDDPMSLVQDNQDFQKGKALFDKGKAIHDFIKDPKNINDKISDIKANFFSNLFKEEDDKLVSTDLKNVASDAVFPIKEPAINAIVSINKPKTPKIRKAKAVKEVDELYYVQSGLIATSSAWEGEMKVLELFGEEGISNLYEYQVSIQTLTTIELNNQGVYISGKIDDIDVSIYGYIGKVEYAYHGAILICKVFIFSPLNQLKLSGKNRIFEKKTYLEVLTSLLDELGVEYEDKSSAQLEAKDYIVQYEQSDIDFIYSLLNKAGLLFAFQHDSDSVKMLILSCVSDMSLSVDQAFQYGNDSKDYGQKALGLEEDNVYAVKKCYFADQNTIKGFASKKYDFTSAEEKNDYKTGEEPFKQIIDEEADENMLTLRLNDAKMYKHKINLVLQYFLMPGTSFDFILFKKTVNYIALNVKYSLQFNNKMSRYVFRAEVEAVKSDTEIIIKKDVMIKKISGVQLGKVLGEEGQETNTDEWGRVRVRFFWDDKYITDDSTDDACWARVMHSGAAGTSHFYLPRVGDEVMIVFENGDPEKPVVIGSLYNSINTISHDPSSTDISYWKMLKSGQTEVANEISMTADDAACLLKINACQDLQIDTAVNFTHNITEGEYKIEHSSGDYNVTLTEGNMKNLLTKGNLTDELTEGNYDMTLTKGKYDLTLTEGDYKAELTKGKYDLTLTKGNLTTTLDKGNNKLTLTKGDYTKDITGNYKTNISDKTAIDAKGNFDLTVGKNRTISVEKNDKLTINSGNYTINIDGGKLTINASQSILLKSPQITCSASGTLTLDAGTLNLKGKTGIKMQSPQITCEATGALSLKGGGTAKVEGGGMLELKGAMIKLN